MQRQTMSEAEAKTFGRISLANAAQVVHQLKCGCMPYQDVFTYHRWLAQGYQVKRGERAIRLPLIKMLVDEDENGDAEEVRRLLGTSAVFCRCQVKKINGKGA